MCGINLILDLKGKADPAVIDKMNEAGKHRGPDNSKTISLVKNRMRLYLGVTRLRITDHNPESDQPMENKSENRFFIFNGEVYNHFELKNSLLRKGYGFNTGSDTESVFKFIDDRGSGGMGDLNGMFALVYVNWETGHFLIARDRWGMKPLYYYQDEDFLIISSEISGILATGLIRKELNERQIANYLMYRYTLPPETLYRGICQFQKGEVYEYRVNGSLLKKNDFAAPDLIDTRSLNSSDVVAEVEERLIDSLISHTSASVPVGLFLSGGIDSTLMLALCSRHQIPLQHSFTISNSNSDRNAGTLDFRYSELAAKKYGHPLEMIEVDETILDELENYIDKTDHPVGDGAGLLTLLLSVKAKGSTGVVLSGAGADELFAGYNRHRAFHTYLKYYSFFKRMSPIFNQLISVFPGNRDMPYGKRLILWRKFLSKIDASPENTYDRFMSLEFSRKSPPRETWPVFSDMEFVPKNLISGLERDRNEYLPEDVLTISDRMTMQAGLEMRMPYLDQRLYSFIYSLDPMLIIKYGRKWILRELLKKYDGRQFINRPKEGFGMPFSKWICSSRQSNMIDQLKTTDHVIWNYVDYAEVQQMLRAHLSHKIDYSQEIWSFLILTLWLNKHFG